MKGKISHIEDLRFRGTMNGHEIILDDGTDALSPMQALLLSLAACTAMDVWYIMIKKRQPITNLEVEVDGERREEHPKVFKRVRLEYLFEGDVDEEACRQAIDLSLQKYCSISHMVKETAAMETSYRIVRNP
ncbi:MAG: OsmC family peroxiredoxin [Thermoplasmata archaeon]|nr:MAG: OsmC family peroxiredoxin [Thermoplasmata archaeon]RLF40778.1 MAG: OsmC family peroxiredoxin [Thermoplasmata archaeon]